MVNLSIKSTRSYFYNTCFILMSLIGCCIVNNTKASGLPNSSIEQNLSAPNTIKMNKVDDILAQADKLRSSNNSLSRQLVSALSTQQGLTKKQQAYLNYLIALQHGFNKNYTQVEPILSTIIADETSTLLSYRAKYTLLNLYTEQKKWSKGLAQVKELLAVPEFIESQYLRSGILSVVSFYNQLEQYQLALNYSEQVLNQSDNNRNICIANQLVLSAKLNSNYPLLDTAEFEQGIRYCMQAKEVLFAHMIRIDLAKKYLQNKQANKAIASMLPHLQNIKATAYTEHWAIANSLLAQAYWLKGDVISAKKYALDAQAHVESLNQIKCKVSLYQLLYQLFESTQEYEIALAHHKKYDHYLSQLLKESQAKHFAFQSAEHNNATNRLTLTQLNQQNQLLTSQNAIAKEKEQNTLLAVLLLLSLLALLSTWAYKSWLNQQRLKQLTDYDQLTKAFSRSYFMNQSELALQSIKQSKQPLSCIIFDLDKFKSINDQYGHQAGDSVLIEVAKIGKKITEQHGVFGRLGGEEFAITLPGYNTMLAENIAENCRQLISEIDHTSLGLHEKISASFGISETGISGFNLTTLLADADNAMYSSKNHGRNCVHTYR